MALTSSRVTIRGDFEPLPGSVYHTPFPYCYPGRGRAHDPHACTLRLGGAAGPALRSRSSRPNASPRSSSSRCSARAATSSRPTGFLPRLREITREHGILLVADEVQTGFGRTGRMFAVEHWDVQPDILTMAKGIASGLPLSGPHRPPRAAGALGTRRARRHVRRQRGRLCRGQRHARRHRATKACVANARSAATQLLDGLRQAAAPPSEQSATCAASAAWWPSSS